MPEPLIFQRTSGSVFGLFELLLFDGLEPDAPVVGHVREAFFWETAGGAEHGFALTKPEAQTALLAAVRGTQREETNDEE